MRRSTIVFLTPVGLDAGMWPALESLPRPAVLHSFPGFGGRPRADPPPTMASLAAEVAGLGTRLDLIGVSLGGMVAQWVALDHPQRVRSLMVCCTGASVDRRLMLERAARADALGTAGVLDETLQRWFTPDALAAPVHPGVEYARRTLLALGRQAFADAWRAMAEHDVRKRLGEIAAVTTCLAGEQDVVAPPPRVRQLAEGIHGARAVTAPGPHMLPLERPLDFLSAVSQHLERIAP